MGSGKLNADGGTVGLAVRSADALVGKAVPLASEGTEVGVATGGASCGAVGLAVSGEDGAFVGVEVAPAGEGDVVSTNLGDCDGDLVGLAVRDVANVGEVVLPADGDIVGLAVC